MYNNKCFISATADNENILNGFSFVVHMENCRHNKLYSCYDEKRVEDTFNVAGTYQGKKNVIVSVLQEEGDGMMKE